MRYAILYDSHSGNTAHVAQTIRHTLPEAECLCRPHRFSEPLLPEC